MFEYFKKAIKIVCPASLEKLETCMLSLNDSEDKFDFRVLETLITNLRRKPCNEDMVLEDYRS